MKRIAVAIDGPAAAGKSTIAKLVAKELGFTYIDTGAMYRCVTWFAINRGVDCQNEEEVCRLIKDINIDLLPDGHVLCNEIDVTREIRTTEIANNVSYIASYKDVRLHLVKLQREMAKKSSVVMDGRDIGTYVLPNAEVKIYQVASVKTRAVRRYEENMSKGIICELEQIEEELEKRDYIDSHRDFAPLKPAPDSITIDTSDMTISEVTQIVIDIIRKKLGDL
ncbi:MAG: (d)CMP kinase [Bacilli bacterium]